MANPKTNNDFFFVACSRHDDSDILHYNGIFGNYSQTEKTLFFLDKYANHQ